MTDRGCWEVEIVCTDRQQHKRTWLGRMEWEEPWTPPAEERERVRSARLRRAGTDIGIQVNDETRRAIDADVDQPTWGGWSHYARAGKHDPWFPPSAEAQPGEWSSQRSYSIVCSRCSRTPRWNRTSWIELMEHARLNGMREFDVSYLD